MLASLQNQKNVSKCRVLEIIRLFGLLSLSQMWLVNAYPYIQVPEGYVGVEYWAGKLSEVLIYPGQRIGHTYPNIYPFHHQVKYIKTMLDDDVVEHVQCGAKDGSIHYIEAINIGNTIASSKVVSTVRKYGLDYDETLIFSKVRHQMNIICSEMNTYDLFVTEFHTLDDKLLDFLQAEQDRLDSGVTIEHIRLTKPRLPHEQALLYEALSKERIKQQKEDELQATARKEAEREKIIAEGKAERLEIEARSRLKVAEYEAQMYEAKENAKTNAKTYSLMEEAKANTMLLTSSYLEYTKNLAIANNTKIVFGELPQTMWSTNNNLV